MSTRAFQRESPQPLAASNRENHVNAGLALKMSVSVRDTYGFSENLMRRVWEVQLRTKGQPKHA